MFAANTPDSIRSIHSVLPKRVDVLIVGGGLAGGFLGLELAQAGCAPLLIEAQRAPGWKVGETFPPEGRWYLQRLGYWDRFLGQGHLQCHGIVSTWGNSEAVEKDFIFHPYGHSWQLDRAIFESDVLNAAAEAGCQICFATTVIQIDRQPTGWRVETTHGEVFADWIVDCTGRSAVIVRREGGDYNQIDALTSVCGVGISENLTDGDSRTYLEAVENGWWYSALTPNKKRILAFQTDADLVPGVSLLAEEFLQLLPPDSGIKRLARLHQYALNNPRVIPAHSGRYSRCCGERWIGVGDAAMTFDPLSGQGTYKTLASAREAVQTILNGNDYDAYSEHYWQEYLATYLQVYRDEKRWVDRLFWSRRG